MSNTDRIDITGVDMPRLVKKVYELSRPQGLGMLHYDPAPLTDEEAQFCIRKNGEVDMDYVKGRACKFYVWLEKDGQFLMSNVWYDHTDSQLQELLAYIQIKAGESREHGCACNCDVCRGNRGEAPYKPEQHFKEIIGHDT